MKADGTFRITRPRPRRKWRQIAAHNAPLAVWLLAIVAALKVHEQMGPAGRFTGYAEDTTVTVAHLEPGTVRNVLVREHELVEQGQLLVTMDVTEERQLQATIQKDIERLRSEVLAEAARVSAENARADGDRGEHMRRLLVDREAAHIEYLAQVMTNTRDRIQLRGDEVEYDIVRRLHKGEDAAFRELNEIETRVHALREQVDKNEVVLARMKDAFTEADRRWHNFREQDEGVIPFDPIITPLRLAAEVREAELNELYQLIESHSHRAPIAGQVTSISARPGDQLLSGAPLLTISAPRTDRGIVYLAENEVLSVQTGDRVMVRRIATGRGADSAFEGKIVRMSSVVTEAPLRFRAAPNWPVWGRAMIIALDSKVLMPGEAIAITRVVE
jgi:multidrug resistance efflux pump